VVGAVTVVVVGMSISALGGRTPRNAAA